MAATRPARTPMSAATESDAVTTVPSRTTSSKLTANLLVVWPLISSPVRGG
jgi:hypothetical protein